MYYKLLFSNTDKEQKKIINTRNKAPIVASDIHIKEPKKLHLTKTE